MGALLADLEQSDRLLFCLYPDAATAGRIAALAHRIRQARGLSGEPLHADRLHVSHHHLGDYAGIPDAILANAFVAGGSVAMAPFTVTFDGVCYRLDLAALRNCLVEQVEAPPLAVA